MYNIILVISFIVILRYFVVNYMSQHVDFETKSKVYYLLFVLIVFLLSFYCSNRYEIALMMALIALGSRVIYRYNIDASKKENSYKNDISFALSLIIICSLSFYFRKK